MKVSRKKKNSVRLPRHITPTKYKIHLEPDLEEFIFAGEEEIFVDILKKTKKITLHSAEIEILSVEYIKTWKTYKGRVEYDPKEETATLSFPEALPEGEGSLKLTFTGVLNDKMRGFYRSRYEIDGKAYHMGVTQFESTDARRAFPCFDEPDRKAVFEVSLKVPADRVALSNTLEIETEIPEHESGYKVIKFEPTPKMSSYLLAFIVGHFEYVEKRTDDGVLVRVFTTPGKKKQAEFALDVASRIISFYTKYFNIPYPLPDLDLIAIPDFAAGAMENWGAITYRETALLVDEANTSLQNKQWVALVIAHELAHQWFGNLVTMEWWTHLWLNEGFASYMEYVAVDNLFPEWDIWSQYVFMEHARALALDGLENTHAIEVDVNHPAEISEIFDAVSYSKGSSIIRMLAEYLGEENFREGLRLYLTRHAYSNAKTEDLWKALEEISGEPVGKIMRVWTRQPGYPLVSLSDKGKNLALSQKRFHSSALVRSDNKSLWKVPLSIITKKEVKPTYYLLDKKTTLIPKLSEGEWLKINSGETGFLRVQYPPEFLSLLREPIEKKDSKLPQEDRLGIIRDAFTLGEAGSFPTDEALKLALYYKEEESFIVWIEIVSQILNLKNLFYGEKFYDKYEQYSRDLFRTIGEKLGFEKIKGEPHARTLLRSTILHARGVNKDSEVVEFAKKQFKENIDNTERIDPDLRGTVYIIAAENSGEREYEEFVRLYRKTNFQEEKDRITRAMCSFKDKKLLEKALLFSLSREAKSQDLFKNITFVWGNPVGRHLAWEFLKDHWRYIVNNFEGGHLFTRFISPAANFTTEKEAKAFEEFFKKNKVEGIERTVAQTLEQIRSNASWIKRDSARVNDFLRTKTTGV